MKLYHFPPKLLCHIAMTLGTKYDREWIWSKYERWCQNYLDMTLSAQVVDLSGFDLIDDLHQACAVCQVPVMQLHV